MFNILKKFWNFLKDVFGGAEISNKNNTTQINKVKKNKNSVININQINNEKEKDND